MKVSIAIGYRDYSTTLEAKLDGGCFISPIKEAGSKLKIPIILTSWGLFVIACLLKL